MNSQDMLRRNVEITAGAVPIDALIPGSDYFRRFAVQILGVQAAQTVDITASLDGVTWNTIHSTVATTDGAGNVIFEFENNVTFRGGLKIVFANNNAGTILVRMASNPFQRRSSHAGF